MNAEKIYELMVTVSKQLEELLARKDFVTQSELTKYTQVLKEQQVPAPDPARLAQLLLPALVAQLPTQLPLKVEVPAEKIAELLSPVVNQQVKAIEVSNRGLLSGLSQHLTAMKTSLDAGLQASKETADSLRAAAASIPRKVPVDFLRGWRELLLTALGPMTLVLLLLLIGGAFSKEPVATYNSVVKEYGRLKRYSTGLKAQGDSLQQKQAGQQRELNFYRAEVQRYRQKNPKAKALLPLYSPTGR